MRIARVELRHVRMPYTFPLETSVDRDDAKDCLLIRVEADGVSGWGESPVTTKPFYKEETTDTAWPILAKFLIPRVLGRSFEHPREVAAWVRPVRRHYMAKAGLEAAVWDAYARAHGVSLSRALGGVRDRIEAGMSVGIEPNVDANSAYTLADLPVLRELDAFDLLMIEQPLDHDDIVDHAALQQALRTPVCLDESIASAEDARKALDLGSCRIINIKAARMGGLSEAVRCHDLCVRRNVPVWCGGFLETGVGRAANIALASLPGFTLPADMGASRRYFPEDIIDPWIEVAPDGTVAVPTGPGLGVTVVQALVDKYTVRREVFEEEDAVRP